MLLLVANEVLGARLDSGTLDAPDGVGKKFSSEIWVRRETLPVATTLRRLLYIM